MTTELKFKELLNNITGEQYQAIYKTLETVSEIGLEKTMLLVISKGITPKTKPIQVKEEVNPLPEKPQTIELKTKTKIFPEEVDSFIKNWKNISTFGGKVKYLRHVLNLTQAQFATTVGVGMMAVNDSETRNRVYTPKQLLRLKSFLLNYDIHLTIEDILGYSKIEKHGRTNTIKMTLETLKTVYEKAKFIRMAAKLPVPYVAEKIGLDSGQTLANREYGVTHWQKYQVIRFIETVNSFGYLFKLEDIWMD